LKALKWILGLIAGLAVVIGIAAAWLWVRLHPAPPEVQVWRGGRILTMDDESRVATAIAIEKDRIAAVGDDKDVEPWLGRADVTIDLAGRTVVPGFIEAHGHFPAAGLGAVAADLNSPPIGEVSTVTDAVAALREIDESRPGSGWLIGFGYDDTMLAEKRHLTRDDLDDVSASRPVIAMHISGHMVVANSLALDRYGIDRDTPDPSGGEIERDPETGEPTGLLLETAGRPMLLDALRFPPLDQVAVVQSAVAAYARQGFTTVQNGLATEEQLQGMSAGSRVGLIPLRVVAWPADELALRLIDDGGDFSAFVTERMHVGAVKFVGDGSIQGYTGYLREPYYVLGDHPEGYRGYPNIDADTMREHVKKVHCAGYQVAVHGNGDAAIDQFLDAWEAAVDACPKEDARPILVHAQMSQDDQLKRMRDLGVTPTFFSAHVFYWGDRHRDIFLGPERAARISPARSAEALGLRFTTHLDTPVVPIDSRLQLWTPVARETSSGVQLGPEERIGAERALRAMTIDAAWQNHLEDDIGSIEPGKMADLVVLSADPADPSVDIRTVEIERTVVGGLTVYETAAGAIPSRAP
jgi:predicted amidohydrolase YtcJ